MRLLQTISFSIKEVNVLLAMNGASSPSSPKQTLRSRGQGGRGSFLEGIRPHSIVISENYPPKFLQGLTVAGVGASILSTVFSLFYVDVFLRVYEIPLTTYATGSMINGIVSTANDVMGAWLVDMIASGGGHRWGLIGMGGCMASVCFLTPFFRWATLPGVHFVVSMCLYDAFFSFTTTLMGSVVTDHSTMSDKERVRFMASGKAANLIASFLVARIGLEVFETNEMGRFQLFLLILAIGTCILFVTGQIMMDSNHAPPRVEHRGKRNLQLRKVIREFWDHENFRAWIGMEMLLECQLSFVTSFMKTFVDRLVMGDEISRDTCDLVLSLIRPVTQIAGILCYIPIRQRGYPKVYMWLFAFNLFLAFGCLLAASPSSPWMILLFLLAYTMLTSAVQSAGFHLAMSDMVLELKYKHVSEDRLDEPSLAALFMGANALLSKPAESLLPIIAALVLDETHFQDEAKSEKAQWVLFYLLIGPPLIFSGLQILAWRHYTLHPQKTGQLREELKKITTDSQNDVLWNDKSSQDQRI